MNKEVFFEPMGRMLRGFDKTANAVVGTLGPKGRNVFIDDAIAPKITNDGATIAQNIQLEDKVENMGAYLIRNTSSQTNDDAGDGTTTTACILQSIVHECLKRPENPMEVRNSLNEASLEVLKKLEKQAVKIDKKDIKRVALISAENEQIADIISEIVNKVEDAVINVEDSRTFETTYEIVNGYEANVGFMSSAFITDQKKARAVMTDIPVFCTEKKISSVVDIKPLFEQFAKAGISSAVIVCEDIENTMLGVMVLNKQMGNFNPVVIRATGPLLEDIEVVTGATRVSEKTGVSFQTVDISKHLGRASKVVCDANKTLFIADSPKGKDHADSLQSLADDEPNQYIKKRYLDRVAKLRGGVAVLKVGAATDFEREYIKLKADDAVKAVKAALEEGVVEGGGMALWRIAEEMKPETIGGEILKKSLVSPLRKILENAGLDYAEIIKNLPDGEGYDAKNNKYVNMLEAGIIDPAKVERVAVENAVSAAGTFITTFCTISDAIKDTK